MKILYIMYRFPYPLDKGDKLRAYNQIRYLSKANDIYLCSVIDEPLLDAHYAEIEPFTKKIFKFKIKKSTFYKNLLLNFISGRPLQNAYSFDKGIKKEIEQIIKREAIDAAICLMVRPAEYLTDASIPKLLDYQDAISIGFKRRSKEGSLLKRMLYSSEARRLAKFEQMIFDKYDYKAIITAEDRKYINHRRRDEIYIIGNGIDTEYFQSSDAEKTHELLFVGNMQYEPNVLSMRYLVSEILPIIRLSLPQVKLMIAGADPVDEIKALQSENITVTGRLADIRDAYNQGTIFIAPMQTGTGLQNKLLEAMAMRVAVVTSELCNKALMASEGQHLLIGRTPEEYAAHCVELLKNKDVRDRISDAAYKFVKENFGWDSINSQIDKILTSRK